MANAGPTLRLECGMISWATKDMLLDFYPPVSDPSQPTTGGSVVIPPRGEGERTKVCKTELPFLPTRAIDFNCHGLFFRCCRPQNKLKGKVIPAE